MTSDPIRSMVHAYATTHLFRFYAGAIVVNREEKEKYGAVDACFKLTEDTDTLVARLNDKKPKITSVDDGFVSIVFEQTGLGQIEFIYKDGPFKELYPVVNFLPVGRLIPRNDVLRVVASNSHHE